MTFKYMIAFRYLKGRHKLFFSSSNFLSFLGIVIGVFSLLVVSSVMNGFDKDMRDRVLGSKAEIRVHTKDYSQLDNYEQIVAKIRDIPEVKVASPICENELILQKGDKIIATIANGVNFDEYRKLAKVLDNIVVGDPNQQTLEEDGIIMGLGASLALQATVGEYVSLSSPLGTVPTPFGLLPLSKKFKVVGILSSDLPEFNSLYSFISLENGQFFSETKEAVHRIDVSTFNPSKSAEVAKLINTKLGDNFVAEDWSEFESNLFNAIKLEKAVMFFVLSLMLVIASFNMIGNFTKLVTEKRSEIGILKALGASHKDIRDIFILVGIILGSIGAFIGLSLALILLLIQQHHPFISIPVAGFPLVWLPVEISILNFVFVPILVVVISYITTLYPADKALKIEAIKIIRNQD